MSNDLIDATALDESLDSVDELPDLTDQQFAFVKDICAGKTAKQAYADNYNTDNCADRTVAVLGSRLKNSPAIKQWLAAVKREQLSEASYTKTEHLRELDEVIHEARAKGNYGAAITGLINKGKAAGHYQDNKVVEGEIVGADALFAWITERTKQLETKH